jgi:hypothetical protein
MLLVPRTDEFEVGLLERKIGEALRLASLE